MESRLPVMAKKVWSLVRVMFFMLKKGIAKRKFLLDLDMMMKRGKIAGKAFHNLMFHHHHNWAASAFDHHHPQHLSFTAPLPGEYEFSCSNTPPYPLSLFSTHKKRQNKSHRLATTNPPLAPADDCVDIITNSELLKALDIMIASSMASPPLPARSRTTPMVEPLSIKDSPLALIHGEEDGQVDEAAERFIRRFYNDRIREN
ncbi:uncharacterized protein LOC112511729 [Cynara cardunculus var. scolymus]|uniref:uncharacterized protein LOC112511729 n=1 Tax=Cynara cardunculus var. scolymus TaxID=59895 RepID=UPI000D623852|nr:uncharacterized protein LOC112511729 [Cynara cardunculus var. scolymus]